MNEKKAESPARLPEPRGKLSALVMEMLVSAPADAERNFSRQVKEVPAMLNADIDPLADDDLNLAIYVLYGLHYRSFAGVESGWEWNPTLLDLRRTIEALFSAALRSEVPHPPVDDHLQVGRQLFELESQDDGPSLSRVIERDATIEQLREFVIQRSAYQLKEADPHSWAIPRLTGGPKTALLEIQYDEYGSGRTERMHSRLFARTMDRLDLDSTEDAYLDLIPGSTLASVNLISLLGLHRGNLGALVGHLAMFEMTSSKPNRAYGNGLRRLGYSASATDFYDEHVEADAIHENIAAHDLAGRLAREQPQLAADILFGASALLHLEARIGNSLLSAWTEGHSTLRSSVVGA